MLSQFVGDAAPGEAAAIARDIDLLSNGNHATKAQVTKELVKLNEASLRVVKVKDFATVLSKYNARGDNVYYSRGYEFSVDPTSGITSNTKSAEPLSPEAKSLLTKLEKYGSHHYTNPVVDVFSVEDGSLAVVIVGEKLSPRNFFNGAWAAQYLVSKGSITGDIKVDVHYFEDGNVRLKAKHGVNESGDTIKVIEASEDKFQKDLTAELAQLNERQFKALRRQLPVTRSQMVWSKATAGYKIGSELEKR